MITPNNALVLFREKEYEQAYKVYEEILSEDKSDKRYQYLNSIMTCLRFLYEKSKDDEFFIEFEKYLDEYLEIATITNTNSWANNIIEDLLEYLIEMAFIRFTENDLSFDEQENSLKNWLSNEIKKFIEPLTIEEKRPEKLFYDVILQKIFKERANLERKGHEYQNVVNAKFLGELFIDFTEDNAQSYIRSRSNIYQLFSELIYNDPSQKNIDYYFLTRKAVSYLDKSIDEFNKNLFAINRKHQLVDSLTIQEQLHRFDHDVSSKIPTLQSLVRRISKKAPTLTEPARMENIIQDLNVILNLSRNQIPDREKIDLIELLEEVKKESSLEIGIAILGKPEKWYSNFVFLKTIFENLIKNSREAYERKKIAIPTTAIKITVNFSDGTIILKDFAGGIRPDLLHNDKLFEPYISEKGIAQGTGLGLATVKKACNNIKLDIKIQSENDSAIITLTQKK